MPTTQREIHLASRPEGWPTEDNFELVETEVSEPDEKEILVRNLFMSVDPYMRGRMRDVKSYVPPFQIGEVLSGGSVGRVEASRHPGFSEGDIVVAQHGWRELYTSDGGGHRVVDGSASPSHYLGVMGMPGMTAYVGLVDIGQPKRGETLFVSAAAGAVGSVVGQIGKVLGCRVVGSAGSDDKVSWLVDDLGFDAAINYKSEDLDAALSRTCPEGIDIYFENVGGRTLEAVLGHMRPFGRIPVCGMIALYNTTEPQPGPANLINIIPNRLTLKGFIVSDHMDRMEDFLSAVGGWVAEGRIKVEETVIEGIENAPRAFIGMLGGENTGKMVVKVGA